jgi:hypothetical protein
MIREEGGQGRKLLGVSALLDVQVDPEDYREAMERLMSADASGALDRRAEEVWERHDPSPAEVIVVKEERGADVWGSLPAEASRTVEEELRVSKGTIRAGALPFVDEQAVLRTLRGMERLPAPMESETMQKMPHMPEGRVRKRLEVSITGDAIVEAQALLHNVPRLRRALRTPEFAAALQKCGMVPDDVLPWDERSAGPSWVGGAVGVVRSAEELEVLRIAHETGRLRKLTLACGEAAIVRELQRAEAVEKRHEEELLAKAEALARKKEAGIWEGEQRRVQARERAMVLQIKTTSDKRQVARRDMVDAEMRLVQREHERLQRIESTSRQRAGRAASAARGREAQESKRAEKLMDNLEGYNAALAAFEARMAREREQRRIAEMRRAVEAEEVRNRRQRASRRFEYQQRQNRERLEDWSRRMHVVAELEEKARRDRERKESDAARGRMRFTRSFFERSVPNPGPGSYDPDLVLDDLARAEYRIASTARRVLAPHSHRSSDGARNGGEDLRLGGDHDPVEHFPPAPPPSQFEFDAAAVAEEDEEDEEEYASDEFDGAPVADKEVEKVESEVEKKAVRRKGRRRRGKGRGKLMSPSKLRTALLAEASMELEPRWRTLRKDAGAVSKRIATMHSVASLP